MHYDGAESVRVRACPTAHLCCAQPYVKSFLFDATPAVSNVSNVAWALTESNSTVSDWKVKKIDKARFLRFVLHFAGDIHQPLHAATQYDQNRFPVPKGDEGIHVLEWCYHVPSLTLALACR